MRQKDSLTCDNKMTPNSANRLPAILKNNQSLVETCTSVDGFSVLASPASGATVSSPNSPHSSTRTEKPPKRVSFRLSELRRQSLTGSLPDLNKATKRDVHTSSANLKQEIQIERDPLPEGSTAFRAVMDELDTDTESDSDDSTDPELRRSWNEGDASPRGKKLYTSRGQTFQSKAAAAIYSKVYVPSLQKSRNKLTATNAPKTPNVQDRGYADGNKSPNTGKSKKDCCANSKYLTPPTVGGRHHSPCCSPRDRRSKNIPKRSPSPARRLLPLNGTPDKLVHRKTMSEVRKLQKS